MSKRGDEEFLRDIIESINRINNYIREMRYEEFLQDIKTQDAIVRNIQIIGEAIKNLSSDFRDKYKDIDWKNTARIRDKIVHHYFGIKWEVVWGVSNNNLPELKEKIEKILKELQERGNKK
ncbi:MAG: DUF86 domain-containing protein [Candidatus Edwardsbacteria bacterium]